MAFIGMFDSDENNSDIIDFGILTKCDHLILSHGTFGLWTAILTNKNENFHVLPANSTEHELISEEINGLNQFIFL